MATGTALQPQKKSKHSHYLLAGVLILVALVLGWPLAGGNKVEEGVAHVVGLEEYAYGYPLVMMDVTREVLIAASTSGQYSALMNRFARIRTFVDPAFKNVVRISVNSLGSHGFVDLDQEPMVVSTPDMDGRYVGLGLNMWTDDFMSAETRTNGAKATNYLISGPKWNGPIPKDVDQSLKSTTRYSWVLVRMAAASPADFPAIHAKQEHLKITPLSGWGKPCALPATAPVNPNVDLTPTLFDQVRLMSGEVFFNRLARILVDNPRYIRFHNPKMQCFIARVIISASLHRATLGPDRGYETGGAHF